eukprot:6191251-Pleurochrysis_carterae.AAC.2
MPVIARDAGETIFHCPKSVSARAAPSRHIMGLGGYVSTLYVIYYRCFVTELTSYEIIKLDIFRMHAPTERLQSIISKKVSYAQTAVQAIHATVSTATGLVTDWSWQPRLSEYPDQLHILLRNSLLRMIAPAPQSLDQPQNELFHSGPLNPMRMSPRAYLLGTLDCVRLPKLSARTTLRGPIRAAAFISACVRFGVVFRRHRSRRSGRLLRRSVRHAIRRLRGARGTCHRARHERRRRPAYSRYVARSRVITIAARARCCACASLRQWQRPRGHGNSQKATSLQQVLVLSTRYRRTTDLATLKTRERVRGSVNRRFGCARLQGKCVWADSLNSEVGRLARCRHLGRLANDRTHIWPAKEAEMTELSRSLINDARERSSPRALMALEAHLCVPQNLSEELNTACTKAPRYQLPIQSTSALCKS